MQKVVLLFAASCQEMNQPAPPVHIIQWETAYSRTSTWLGHDYVGIPATWSRTHILLEVQNQIFKSITNYRIMISVSQSWLPFMVGDHGCGHGGPTGSVPPTASDRRRRSCCVHAGQAGGGAPEPGSSVSPYLFLLFCFGRRGESGDRRERQTEREREPVRMWLCEWGRGDRSEEDDEMAWMILDFFMDRML
jgi:hypothetical protein